MIIEDINSQGNGVGRMDGKAVFVPGTIVGEDVAVAIDQRQKNFDIGHVESILCPSAHRVQPPCPYFLVCGGCDFLHMDYEEQLASKQRIVEAALCRIGKLDVPVEPIVGSPQQFFYRNKASFPVGSAAVGYFRKNSKQIVDIESCQLCDPRCMEVLLTLKTWAKSQPISHIVVRVCGEDTMATIVTSQKPFAAQKQLLNLLAPLQLRSIYLNYNSGSTILSNDSVCIAGEQQLTQTVLGNRFPVSPTSFLQVNPAQVEKLYTLALDAFDLTGKTVLDAYCGIGTLSLAAARQAKQVIGVEVVASAIADAQNAAQAGGIGNAAFVQDKVERFLSQPLQHIDVAFVDPPRAGLDAGVIDALSQQEIGSIVYVSCSPQTLARDLARFVECGYRVTKVTPVDMFPNTAHVECVAVMERKIDGSKPC